MVDVYLDSSALVKRYVQEPGTPAVDSIFDRASQGGATIATSLWNLGEALGVLDYRRERRLLTEPDFHLAVQNLASEIVRLMRSGAMQVHPVRASLLVEAWTVVLAQHLYEADALQISTCNSSKSRALITSDERLRKASLALGLKAFDPEKQQDEIEELFENQTADKNNQGSASFSKGNTA